MLTILTLTKCLQNLLRDSTLSVISIAKKILFKVVSMMLKMLIVTFFLTTLYLCVLVLYHPIPFYCPHTTVKKLRRKILFIQI